MFKLKIIILNLYWLVTCYSHAQTTDKSHIQASLRSVVGETHEISDIVKNNTAYLIIKFDETTCNYCVHDLLAKLKHLEITQHSNLIIVGFFRNLRSQKIFENDYKLVGLTYSSKDFLKDQKLFKSSKPILFIVDENSCIIHQLSIGNNNQVSVAIELITKYHNYICQDKDFME